MPLHRRLPKRGFTNIFRKDYVEVSLDRIEQAIEAGRLDAGQTIDAEALKAAGIIKRAKDGVRLLGGAEPTRQAHASMSPAPRARRSRRSRRRAERVKVADAGRRPAEAERLEGGAEPERTWPQQQNSLPPI